MAQNIKLTNLEQWRTKENALRFFLYEQGIDITTKLEDLDDLHKNLFENQWLDQLFRPIPIHYEEGMDDAHFDLYIDMMVACNKDLATVKKPKETEIITRDEFNFRKRVISASKRDIIWWAEHFFRIVNMTSGLEIIKLYKKQKDLLHFLIDNDRSIVLASRQTGKCVFSSTKVNIRNKKTGKIEEISIENLFNRTKK